MKRAIIALAVLLASCCVLCAQQPVVVSQPAAGTNQPVFPITSANPLPVTIPGISQSTPLAIAANPYPPGSTPVENSGTGTTGAITVALAAQTSHLEYVCGIYAAATATAGTNGNATVSGPTTTLNFLQGIGLSPLVAVLSQSFSPCIPASAVNTAITLTTAAPGTGGVASAAIWGYYQ